MKTKIELDEAEIKLAVHEYLDKRGITVTTVHLNTRPSYDWGGRATGTYTIKAEVE